VPFILPFPCSKQCAIYTSLSMLKTMCHIYFPLHAQNNVPFILPSPCSKQCAIYTSLSMLKTMCHLYFPLHAQNNVPFIIPSPCSCGCPSFICKVLCIGLGRSSWLQGINYSVRVLFMTMQPPVWCDVKLHCLFTLFCFIH